MDQAMVDAVRRFNRIVTQRVGALDDHFLARDRPLGEARVLWEIGEQGCDVRRLRAQLQLDSGYLSRLLRSLEAAGLISVESSERDRRIRTVTLTDKGRGERQVLDHRSDKLARSLLDPLTDTQRQRLTSAMEQVDRLLTAALVDINIVDPSHRHAQHCLAAYYSELDERFDSGFEVGRARPTHEEEMRRPAGVFCMATLRDEPIGCGALKFHPGGSGESGGSGGSGEPGASAELKRLWVDRQARGLGVGRRLLHELEAIAVAEGNKVIRLDTNRTLTEAIAMYRSAGYVEVDRFNDEPYAHHWFEKRLP